MNSFSFTCVSADSDANLTSVFICIYGYYSVTVAHGCLVSAGKYQFHVSVLLDRSISHILINQ